MAQRAGAFLPDAGFQFMLDVIEHLRCDDPARRLQEANGIMPAPLTLGKVRRVREAVAMAETRHQAKDAAALCVDLEPLPVIVEFAAATQQDDHLAARLPWLSQIKYILCIHVCAISRSRRRRRLIPTRRM